MCGVTKRFGIGLIQQWFAVRRRLLGQDIDARRRRAARLEGGGKRMRRRSSAPRAVLISNASGFISAKLARADQTAGRSR